MKFDLNKSIEVLSRTPLVLQTLLSGLSDDWTKYNEGENTWSPYDVIGHLIHGEKTDWVERTHIILSDSEDKTFIPFDRFAQMNNEGKASIGELLDEFEKLRKENLKEIINLQLTPDDLLKTGIHPELGEVNLDHLLASWVVHDLNHIVQISRVMAKQYKEEVGPWKDYLPILQD